MSSNESFDELEQKIASRFEEALSGLREEFQARLESTRDQLQEAFQSEVATAREQAESTASAEFEEAKAAAIAEALEAKEGEFAEILAAKDATIAELEEARNALMAETEEAKQAIFAEAEEAKVAAIAEALEPKEAEFSEMLAAAEAAIGEAEEANTAFATEAEELKMAAIAEALEAKESEFSELLASKEQSAQDEAEQAQQAALAEAEEVREAAVAEARAVGEDAQGEAIESTLRNLHQTIARIDAAQTQTEALEVFLEATAGFSSRSLLFLTREDGLQGWGGQGFETEPGHLQEAHFDYDEGTAWSELADGRGTIELSDEACEALCRLVDGSRPREGVLIPMVLRDRLAAALYADRLEEQDSFHLLTLQLLAYITGQALETLPMRTRSATATLRLTSEAPTDEPGLELWQFLVTAEPEETEVEEAAVEPEPAAEPVDFTAAEDTGFEVEEAEPVVPEEPEPIEAAEIEAPPAVEEPPSEVEPPVEMAPPTEVAPPVEVAPPTTEVQPPSAAGAEVAPPEDVDGPGWAFTTRRFDTESGEDATHEEARRLARLLVTEIKLYNEEQVEEGRRGHNIYRTLKEDIDRSRQIYDERVDEAIRADTDYFRDELVKILAAGDNEVMGI